MASLFNPYIYVKRKIITEQLSTQYPLSKEDYGRAMWQIIHSYSASMPEKLSRVDKIKFRQTLADLVEHLPCQDCKDHARTYLKENKPVYGTNEQAFRYYCDFHNHINSATGKEVQDCQALWNKRSAKACENCSTSAKIDNHDSRSIETTHHEAEPIPQSATPRYGDTNTNANKESNNNSNSQGKIKQSQTVNQSATPPNEPTSQQTGGISEHTNTKHGQTINQFLSQSLKPSLEDYKNVSTRMFAKMCENAGVAMPELIFSEKTECSNPESSCTQFAVDKESGKLAGPEAPARVYLNINQYSPRSVIHEALHYISKMKGIDVFLPNHEAEITKGAREIMARDFPVSPYRHYEKTPTHELKDESVGVTPASVDPLKNFKERSRRRLDGFTDTLPYYSKYYHGAKKHKRENPSPQVVPTAAYATGQPTYPAVPMQTPPPEPPPEPASASEGFISMLDPVFAPFADMLGMKARDVNVAHTPMILANGGMVLVEGNVNHFGAMAISLVGSLATLAAGTLSKDSIGYLDKKLLVGLGGGLFWNGALRYIMNPKISEEIVHHATMFGQSLAAGDVNAMVGTLTQEKPKEVEKNPLGKGGRHVPEKEVDPLRRRLSSPLGGQDRPVDRRSAEYALDDITGDIYTDPDATIANQGSFKKPSWFPSMT